MADAITMLRVGVPGPPGAGVSAAEKATFVTSTSPAFTGALTVTKTANPAFLVEQDGGLDIVKVNSTTPGVEFGNGTGMKFWSGGFGVGSTTAEIDGATGAAQFDSTVTTTRIVGDTSVWSVVIDGGGSVITTGVKFDLGVPYNADIKSWDILADQTGCIVVDIWQDTYANFPPTGADSITTGEKPTLSAASKNQDTSLNSGFGWAVTQGRILRFNVDSAATVTRVSLCLHVTRT